MTLSPEDRAAVLDMAAAKVAKTMCETLDIAELITLPIGVVCQVVGLSRATVLRQMATRPMSKGKVGVSLKAIQHYQKSTTTVTP